MIIVEDFYWFMNIKLNCMKKFIERKSSFLRVKILLFIFCAPSLAIAEWHIISHANLNSDEKTQVAYTENKSGHSLEIYKDSVGAIRTRFTLNSKLNLFSNGICPTYQVDLTLVKNTSFNDAPCISNLNWSEFILGYITNNNITSLSLDALLNGNIVKFRYALDNGNYKETSFSLAGSKRATLKVIGNNIIINP